MYNAKQFRRSYVVLKTSTGRLQQQMNPSTTVAHTVLGDEPLLWKQDDCYASTGNVSVTLTCEPMTSKTLSAMHTRMTNICAKFH